jgi:hypothetical protein
MFSLRRKQKKRTFQVKPEMQRTFSLFTLNIIYNSKTIINILSISKLDKAKYKTIVNGSEMLITKMTKNKRSIKYLCFDIIFYITINSKSCSIY